MVHERMTECTPHEAPCLASPLTGLVSSKESRKVK